MVVLSSPKLTRIPVVFVMVTVMSWDSQLMRTSSLWMMGLIRHLFTPTRLPLLVGWNSLCCSLEIMWLISFTGDQFGWRASPLMSFICWNTQTCEVEKKKKKCIHNAAPLCFIQLDWESAEIPLVSKKGVLVLAISASVLSFFVGGVGSLLFQI